MNTIQADQSQKDSDTKKCPFCSELIKSEATKCRFCNEWLNRKCPFCSEIIQSGAMKCRFCNEWLNKESHKVIERSEKS